MAQGPRRGKRAAATRPSQSPDLQIGVPVPQNASITVTDLKTLNDRELSDILEKAKTAKVKFIILNAPFKVRPVQPVS